MLRLLATALSLLLFPLAANAQWQFNGVPVSTAFHYQADPITVTDGAGGAIIAWYDYRAGNYDIYAQRLNAAGVPQWTADGVPLCTQPGNQITVSMVSDDAGGAVVVWYDARNNINTGFDIYAQRVNGSGAALWTADGVPVCKAAADQSEPIVIKSANNYVVAWFDQRNFGIADIYVQALNSVGNWQWVDPDGVALCTAPGDQLHPRLASDGVGGAIVVWADRRTGSDDISARRVDSTGTVFWSATGVVVCNATDDQEEPQIVGDGAAGAIMAWYDWRSGAPDIYMQRLDSAGAPQWTGNGVPICTASFTQDSPRLAPDFSGGAIVLWEDRRNGANFDIYGQRVNAAGAVQWPANGMPLCTAGGNQLIPQVIRDPAGGFFATWTDYRSGNADAYVQRMDYDGPLWTPDGVVLCTEPNLQELPTVCSDGVGGAIVAWRDKREGSYYDIYAEHVNGTPTPVEQTPAVSAVRVLPNYPNPFTATTTIEFVLPSVSDVAMEVYDVAGRRVWAHSLNEADAGRHAVTFSSASLPSGVYFYRVHAGGSTVTKKMVIAR